METVAKKELTLSNGEVIQYDVKTTCQEWVETYAEFWRNDLIAASYCLGDLVDGHGDIWENDLDPEKGAYKFFGQSGRCHTPSADEPVYVRFISPQRLVQEATEKVNQIEKALRESGASQ